MSLVNALYIKPNGIIRNNYDCITGYVNITKLPNQPYTYVLPVKFSAYNNSKVPLTNYTVDDNFVNTDPYTLENVSLKVITGQPIPASLCTASLSFTLWVPKT